MEADLARYYHVDLLDRWRTDLEGRPLLTLRQIAVRVRHLPPDSAVAVALNGGEAGWTRDQVLLTDIWSTWNGKEHPALALARRSRGRIPTAERLRRLVAARRRARDRRRRIARGEIT